MVLEINGFDLCSHARCMFVDFYALGLELLLAFCLPQWDAG